jgi:hypothetical protein
MEPSEIWMETLEGEGEGETRELIGNIHSRGEYNMGHRDKGMIGTLMDMSIVLIHQGPVCTRFTCFVFVVCRGYTPRYSPCYNIVIVSNGIL